MDPTGDSLRIKTLQADRQRTFAEGRVLRGRLFTPSELEEISRLVAKFSCFGRTRISVEVCKALNWKQPNGWLKDRACRDVLRRLHDEGLLVLPQRKDVGKACRIATRIDAPILSGQSPNASLPGRTELPTLTALTGSISLRLAKGNKDEKLWNALVDEHHYLGHTVTVGRCLKFLVICGQEIVAAVSLSEAAWAVNDRDTVLTRLGIDKGAVANNSRFLILPHVKIKNLASRVLGLLAKEGAKEWQRYYATDLFCLETFVDRSRFEGTSYKAANWLNVGATRGYRKVGAAHTNGQTKKYIFIYPLVPKMRERLRESYRVAADKERSQ